MRKGPMVRPSAPMMTEVVTVAGTMTAMGEMPMMPAVVSMMAAMSVVAERTPAMIA